jgi:hypothetical protein
MQTPSKLMLRAHLGNSRVCGADSKHFFVCAQLYYLWVFVSREMGWWLVDADHYTSTDRNIMTYDNNVAAFIQGLEEAEGHMVLLKKHLLGAAYQVAALRDALAIAW